MANEVRIVIRADNRGDAAFRDATRDADRLEHALNDTADAAARVGEEATEAGNEVEAMGDQAGGALDNVGDSAQGAGGLLGRLGPIGAAAGAAVGVAMAGAAMALGALKKAIDASLERANALGRMKAQLLLDPREAARYGRIAGQVYMDNWGESMEDASSIVRDAALYIMPTAAVMDAAIQPSLKVVSERVAALAATMEEDGKKVAVAIQHMLTTGMADSVDEAFNLLHAGIAKGVNSADDLLDTFIEYSTQFRELGINGKEAMGLMSQGLQAGARDADTMADALKELAIKTQEFDNKAAQDAFKKLGINTKTASQEFAAGGARAKAALDDMLQKLNAIKDPLEQRALAIALFGTKAEDLGNALFNMDLAQAAKDFEDIGSAADIAAGHMSGNAYSAIEGYRRQWEMFQADMGDKFLPVFERAMGWIQRFADRVAPTVEYWLGLISKKWSENSESVEEFGQLASIALGVMGEGAIGAVLSGLSMLVDTIIAIGDAWRAGKRWTVFFLEAALSAFDMILKAASLAFGWIPGLGPKLIAASIQFGRFRDEANAALDGILDEDVHVRVKVSQSGDRAFDLPGGSVTNRRIMGSGGTGSGFVIAGDRGPELIDLGASGKVYNNEQTKGILGALSTGAGGAGVAALRIMSDGSTLADLLLQELRGGRIVFIDSVRGRVQVA